MATRIDSKTMTTTAGATVAVLLARVIVPLWLLIGAVLSLMDGGPSHLPVAVIKWAGALGVDLKFLLLFGISVELAVAGVMWLLPRLARTVGLLMLGVFLPVLIGDLLMGASSCGCFGAVEIHPGITLVMDLGFFLGLLLLGRGVPSLAATSRQPTWRVVAAGLWTVASFAIAFGLNVSGPASPATEEGGVVAMAMPGDGYYLPKYDQWLGARWDEVPISAWIQDAPDDLDEGPQNVLFYRKDCEHCHELMEVFFTGPLAVPTTAVAIPDRNGFPDGGVLPFVCDECRLAQLPAGVDWFLTTPVLVRLIDGTVECAAEVTPDDPQCLAM